MKLGQFIRSLPRGYTVTAAILESCVLIAAGGVIIISDAHADTILPALACVALGAFFSIFILALGYVYQDAKRRGMPPVLWVLVAALVPNLLGFLVYFAMRKPIATNCPQCGHTIEAGQRFCSWCGYGSAVQPPPVQLQS